MGLMMNISSRTPEGTPNHCVVCGHDLRLEPSIDTRDAPCPFCGHLLWFPGSVVPNSQSRSRWVSYEGFLIGIAKDRLGPFPPELQRPLVEAIAMLALRHGSLARLGLVRLVVSAESWNDVLRKLQMEAQQAKRRTWAYSAGAFVQRLFRLVFAVKYS
jgi:hypothetical protein